MNKMYDDHNIFMFDYDFDKEELIKYYHEFANDQNVINQHWPWIIEEGSIKKTWMDVENGWERRQMRPSTIKDPAKLKNYPYIQHLLHTFDIFDRAGAGFFKFAKNFQQIVHRDGGDYRVQNHAETTAELKKNGIYETFKQYTLPEGHKGLCSINLILDSDTGVHFTSTNTKEKSQDDPHYIYESALLNVDNHHYVSTSDKERLLFKIQIYEPDFATCVQRLKSKLKLN